MSDTKTGDPKVREFVTEADATIQETLADGDFGYTEAEQYQAGLLKAAQPVLKTYLTGDGPYVLSHVIGLAEAVLGRKI